MEKYHAILRKHYGNHSLAAEAIGISARQYRRIRNGKKPPPRYIENLIKFIAANIKLKRGILI